MIKLRVVLAIAACFFFFVACAPSAEEYKAEAEKRINSDNRGKVLQEAEAAIIKQLAKEEKEKQQNIALEKNKGGKR